LGLNTEYSKSNRLVEIPRYLYVRAIHPLLRGVDLPIKKRSESIISEASQVPRRIAKWRSKTSSSATDRHPFSPMLAKHLFETVARSHPDHGSARPILSKISPSSDDDPGLSAGRDDRPKMGPRLFHLFIRMISIAPETRCAKGVAAGRHRTSRPATCTRRVLS